MNNVTFVVCLLSNILVIGLKAVPVEEDNRNEVMVKQEIEMNCEFEDGEELNCEKCIGKGMNCFWCDSTQKCMPYRWNFPNCQLKNVRKNNCWANWSVVIVLGVTLFAVVIGTICYCFTYFCIIFIDCCQQIKHTREMRRLKKAVETKIAMQHRHDQRRMERKAIKDSIRKKYGIPLASSAFEKFK